MRFPQPLRNPGGCDRAFPLRRPIGRQFLKMPTIDSIITPDASATIVIPELDPNEITINTLYSAMVLNMESATGVIINVDPSTGSPDAQERRLGLDPARRVSPAPRRYDPQRLDHSPRVNAEADEYYGTVPRL